MQDILWTLAEDDRLEAQREVLRRSLTEVINDVDTAMRDAGLTFPIYATVPNSGEAVATIATPLDPSDADWQKAMAIFSTIAGEKLGGRQLRGRELKCAVANGTISAADVVAEDGKGDVH